MRKEGEEEEKEKEKEEEEEEEEEEEAERRALRISQNCCIRAAAIPKACPKNSGDSCIRIYVLRSVISLAILSSLPPFFLSS